MLDACILLLDLGVQKSVYLLALYQAESSAN